MSKSLPPSLPAPVLSPPWRLFGTALLCLLLLGCRIERRDAAPVAGGGAAATAGGRATAFDASAAVATMWQAQVLPTLQARAGALAELRQALLANPDPAGALHGHRERGEGAPWNFAVKLEGQVLAVERDPTTGALALDIDGDGHADALVQIGPVLRGTALRDSLPFISFSAYTNQIEYAQIANALNERALTEALKGRLDEPLVGRRLRVLGAFTAGEADALPRITPVRIEPQGRS